VDGNGENVDVVGHSIGEDLMAPKHTNDDFSAQYSFLKVHFDGITPEVDDVSGAIVGLKASIRATYPANMRLVSWNQRDGCIATFEDEHGDEKRLEFRLEKLGTPDALIQKYKLGAGYVIWPKEMIDWKKDTETKP